MASFSALKTVFFILSSTLFYLSQSRQFEIFSNSIIGIELQLNIGPEATTLQLISETHEWIAIAFNATSMSSGSWSTVYFSSTKSIHDSFLSTSTPSTNPPSLSTSQWTIQENAQSDMVIHLTLSRPNEISDYINLSQLKYDTHIPIIVAFGLYSEYDRGHTRTVQTNLIENTNYTETEIPTSDPTELPSSSPTKVPTYNTYSPTNTPTPSPTVHPTQDPTTSQPTLSPTCSYGTYNENTGKFDVCYAQNRQCCSQTECKWREAMQCNNGNGANCCYKRTSSPSLSPSLNPTLFPTNIPTEIPSVSPTNDPTTNPTTNPTKIPSAQPTNDPTQIPTTKPTVNPTKAPTVKPTSNPSMKPTKIPTTKPSMHPSKNPSLYPTTYPTKRPSVNPTLQPTPSPTCTIYADDDSIDYSDDFCAGQSEECCLMQKGLCQWSQSAKCHKPTMSPSKIPTFKPSFAPTPKPTKVPTLKPTKNTICECQNGINKLKIKYTGENMVDSVEIYSKDNGKKRKICKEKKVQTNGIISCDRSDGFGENTYFSVSYSSKRSGSGSWSKSSSDDSSSGSNSRKCSGYLDTSCSTKDLVGNLVNGCEDLMVVGWQDMNENEVCDERLSENVMPHQAILNKEEKSADVRKRVFDGKVLQISLVIVAAMILFICLFVSIRCGKKMNNAVLYRGHRKKSTEIEGLDLMVSEDLRHRATMSMNNSFVVEMNESDYVDEE